LTQERFLALALEFIEDNYDEILHYYADLFEKCNIIVIKLLTSQPFLKILSQGEEAPPQPHQRTLWMMLKRLRYLQESLVNDRARIKHADEEGSFAHFLLREPLHKPGRLQ
jgi:hypothetical protein